MKRNKLTGAQAAVIFLAFFTVACPKGRSEQREQGEQISVTISPTSASIMAGGTIQFSVSVSGTGDTRVSWSATVGSVDEGGFYTAPSESGTAIVRAESVADRSKYAAAEVTVLSLSQNPPTGFLSGMDCDLARGALNCASEVGYVVEDSGWNVFFWDSASEESVPVSGGGARSVTVSASSPTSVFLFYFSEDNASSGKTEMVSLDINAISPPPVVVSVLPARIELEIGAAQKFTAQVLGDADTSVVWFVNGVLGGSETVGTITDGGIYTAPQTVPDPAAVEVRAQSNADPAKFATAQATIFSLTWTKFFTNPVHEVEARTVIVDKDGRAIVSFQEKIPGTVDTAAGIVVLDKTGRVVSTWTSAVPSEITGMAYVTEEDVFWAAGTIGGDMAHPELRQAWLLKFKNSANPQILIDRRFQLGGKRTEVKTLQIAHGKIWLGAETDDVLCTPTIQHLCTEMRIMNLDFGGRTTSDFGVGYTQDIQFDSAFKPNLKIFVARDYLWMTADLYSGNQIPVAFSLIKYALDGRLIGGPLSATNVYGVRPVEDVFGNFYVSGTHFGLSSQTINNRLFDVDRIDPNKLGLLQGERVWDGDNSGPVSVNIAKDAFANPSGGLILVGSLSRIGVSDSSLTDGGAAAWITRLWDDALDGGPCIFRNCDGKRSVKIWTRRDGNVVGGSVFSWNSGAFTPDGHLILVGSGTDRRSDCGRSECRTAAIMRFKP